MPGDWHTLSRAKIDCLDSLILILNLIHMPIPIPPIIFKYLENTIVSLTNRKGARQPGATARSQHPSCDSTASITRIQDQDQAQELFSSRHHHDCPRSHCHYACSAIQSGLTLLCRGPQPAVHRVVWSWPKVRYLATGERGSRVLMQATGNRSSRTLWTPEN